VNKSTFVNIVKIVSVNVVSVNVVNVNVVRGEEMELEIARGENPYADFFQTAKSEDWREEAQKGTLLTKTKEKVEKNLQYL
jgi:hypothetical protein